MLLYNSRSTHWLKSSFNSTCVNPGRKLTIFWAEFLVKILSYKTLKIYFGKFQNFLDKRLMWANRSEIRPRRWPISYEGKKKVDLVTSSHEKSLILFFITILDCSDFNFGSIIMTFGSFAIKFYIVFSNAYSCIIVHEKSSLNKLWCRDNQ